LAAIEAAIAPAPVGADAHRSGARRASSRKHSCRLLPPGFPIAPIVLVMLGPDGAKGFQVMPFDAKHWRARAEEARVHAEQMKEPVAQAEMLKIAEGYERLARRAEVRERRKNPT
jgi:hypothetical protein